MKSKVMRSFRAILDPELDTGNVKHTRVMFHQLGEFSETLRNCRVAFHQEVVEDVEENDISVGQLKKESAYTKKIVMIILEYPWYATSKRCITIIFIPCHRKYAN